MPTYEYECESCHETFEVRQRISEPPLTRCQRCGGPVRRVISSAPFILKGTGFYVNDYPSEARKKAQSEEKKGGSGGSTSSDSTPTSSAPPSS
jgi:putative FmdB family regulatory protein